MAVGIVEEFDKNSIHVQLQAVESFEDESVALGHDEDVLVSDPQEVRRGNYTDVGRNLPMSLLREAWLMWLL